MMFFRYDLNMEGCWLLAFSFLLLADGCWIIVVIVKLSNCRMFECYIAKSLHR